MSRPLVWNRAHLCGLMPNVRTSRQMPLRGSMSGPARHQHYSAKCKSRSLLPRAYLSPTHGTPKRRPTSAQPCLVKAIVGRTAGIDMALEAPSQFDGIQRQTLAQNLPRRSRRYCADPGIVRALDEMVTLLDALIRGSSI
jgi:hypothetical protein